MNTRDAQALGDDIRFLKRAEIFEDLDPQTLRVILEHGTIETYQTPGSILFQLGDSADAMFVVKSGVVEICRATGEGEALSVVAYLGEGDTIGEMAITTGSPRGSLARVPQMAEVFKLGKTAFARLMQDVPQFSTALLTVMSKRLEERLRKQRSAARYQHLSGDLKYFDLATVIQALAGSGRSGNLAIRSSSGSTFAQIYFDLGRIRYARLGHLRGKHAVYQLFQSPEQESFSFQSGSLPPDFTDADEIVASTTGLLMECVHQQDELRTLKSEFADQQRRFRPLANPLRWEEADTQAVAVEIWRCLHKHASIAEMVAQLPYSEYSIYLVLCELYQKGLIG
jgi:CRP-like cAMP-binding protein